jgi:hypothetical protein
MTRVQSVRKGGRGGGRLRRETLECFNSLWIGRPADCSAPGPRRQALQSTLPFTTEICLDIAGPSPRWGTEIALSRSALWPLHAFLQ